ncbi:MAG: hypothetical protein R2762_12165 [Bryobacteraceae bacterium]
MIPLLGAPPRIDSVFPVGGQRGTTVQAEIRGMGLKGAYELWFAGTGVRAKVINVAPERATDPEAKPDPKKKPMDLLRVELTLDGALEGPYREFRVLTAGGVSNALRLYIHAEKAQMEAGTPHDLAKEAQRVEAPVTVHGRISAVGEVDYYSFRVRAGEELWFQTRSSAALDPGLGIYKLTGSWFDPERATRLAYSDEPVAYPGLTTEASLHYRFEEAGEYLVRVNGFWGHGGPGQNYALAITREAPEQDREEEPEEWNERRWTRRLTPDRMSRLWSRALTRQAEPIPVIDADAEPREAPVKPVRITPPALVVGAIERPGDVDRVLFGVKEGDRLAFEVETPEKTLPLMNPLLRVVDGDGVEALTNILSAVNSNGNVSKQIHPKTVYSFPREGEFTMEIRDITASYGDRGMKYAVLVRPQVPHMGAVEVAADSLNLVAGKADKLSVVTDQEEGFDGYVVLTMEGLPEGVRAVTATEVEPDTPPSTSISKRERFVAKNQKATLLLIADAGAPPTRTPAMGRVYAQPVVKGELGSRFLVKEIPVMVVSDAVKETL